MSWSSVFFFSSRRRHTRCSRDWSSDVCSSDLGLRDVIQDTTLNLVAKLTPGQAQHLLDAFDALEGAISGLPDHITDALSFKVPATLVSAISAVNKVVDDVQSIRPTLTPAEQAIFDQLKDLSGQIGLLVPAVQRTADFLFKILGLPMPDFSLDAGHPLKDNVLDPLNATIATPPAGLTDPHKQELTDARDLLQNVANSHDLLGLARAFKQ